MYAFRTFILFTCLTLIGFALVPRLSIQFLPSTSTPTVTVQYAWVGASPEVLEREVTSVLEGAFNLVLGIKRIYSVTNRGTGRITLDLEKETDLDFLRFEIASKIRQIYSTFPKGVSYPQLYLNDPESEVIDRPILVYSLSGNDLPETLYKYASEGLSPRLASIEGIQNIQVRGGNESEWKLIYDEALLMQLGVKKSDVLKTLRQHFERQNLGQIEWRNQSFFVVLDNATDWKEQTDFSTQKSALLNLPIINQAGRIILLGDLVKIEFLEKKPTQFYRINAKNSIRLVIYPENGVNQLELAQTIKKVLQKELLNLPNSYQLFLDEDATEYLRIELDKIIKRTIWSLVILLFFVVLTYRNWQYPTIVFLSLLANLGIASIFYYFFKVELHLYALAGITVSFGIIIDNSIVMMHHWKTQGNRNVFPALLASTLTTISALVIIWFLPEKWQLNLMDFAEVLAINLMVSVLVAVWLIPNLMTQLGSKGHPKKSISSFRNRRVISKFYTHYSNLISFLIQYRKTAILVVILTFGLPIFMMPNKIENLDWYNKTFGNDWYIENAKPILNKWLGGTLRLFSWYVYEGASFRQAEETVLYVRASMPTGATIEQMNEVIEKMEAYLGQFSVEIRQFVTQISNGQNASIQIYFNEEFEWSFPHQLKNRLVAFSLNLGGVKWNVYGVGRGFSNDNSAAPPRFRVSMFGYNKSELERQALNFAEKLVTHPRIKEVNTEANFSWREKDLYELKVDFDKRKLAQSEISPIMVKQFFDQFNQNQSPDFRLPERTPIRLVSNELAGNNRWRIENIPRQKDSLIFLFSDFGTIKKEKVAASIHKENQQYIQMIEFEYTGSGRFGSQYLNEKMTEMKKELPLGYSMERRQYEWGKAKQKQYALFLLVIGLIFFICAMTFESLRQAFAIILLIPTSFIGIFLTFYGFDFPFDQGGYTSFLLASGLVVNSLILILNDYNSFQKKYGNTVTLRPYLKAFQHKITPILLTIFSTALGLTPFLMHGDNEVFWFSLAVGTIGGLLFSIVVILFFIPLFIISKNN